MCVPWVGGGEGGRWWRTLKCGRKGCGNVSHGERRTNETNDDDDSDVDGIVDVSDDRNKRHTTDKARHTHTHSNDGGPGRISRTAF